MQHMRAHFKSDKSEVVALYDTNPDRLRLAVDEFGFTEKQLYNDESFYDDPDIEAISIHTGDNDHCQPFLEAVKRNKHVLVEKPLANTEEDVMRMVQAARRADSRLKIQVGYILRFNPVWEAVKRLCEEGHLGNIYYLEGDYIHNLTGQKYKTDSHTGKNWYLEHERPMVGGGSHPLDLLRWFSGQEIVSVKGYSNHVAFPEMEHDDCQVALYKFSNGSIAKIAALYAPKMDMAPWYNIRIYGTRGTVYRDQVALVRSEDNHHPDFVPIDADRVKGHPYDNEILDWLDAIIEDRPTRTNIYDGANSTMATLRACSAIKENRTIDVPVSYPVYKRQLNC